MSEAGVVLVVGASRGLGLALAEAWCSRGWRVIATARGPCPSLEALVKRYPAGCEIRAVDTADFESVRTLKSDLAGVRLDILFVNAGVATGVGDTPLTASEGDYLQMMLVNALSPVRFVEAFEDLVAEDGVIAVMSSELGSISGNSGFWTLYSSSKAALNMLMKGFAGRRQSFRRAVILVAPGWVRTDMGGPQAHLGLEESIPLVVEMVEAQRGRPGLRFLDRFGVELPW